MGVDGAGLLREPFPAHIGDRLVAEAEALAEVSAALYVVDVDGRFLWRLAGSDGFPHRFAVSAIGPEVPCFAFEELALHRLQVAIIPRNRPSRRVAEKLELREEGVAVRYLEINGVWEDHVRYAITSEEWAERGDAYIRDWIHPAR